MKKIIEFLKRLLKKIIETAKRIAMPIGIFLFVAMFFGGIIMAATTETTDTAGTKKNSVKKYEVVSVYQYISIETNRFGDVKDQSLKYSFMYVDNNGRLHKVDEFEHVESGYTQVCIGDKDEYVVKQDTYRILYLTKETLKNMQSK